MTFSAWNLVKESTISIFHRHRILDVLCLYWGLVLVGCQEERYRAQNLEVPRAVATTSATQKRVSTYSAPPKPLPADFGKTTPPVVYLAAYEIHHMLNAYMQLNAYGEYFWRREWVTEEYPYTEYPGGVYNAEVDTVSTPWLEHGTIDGEFHPFAIARKALGDRLSPLWVGLYVNDPALAGPVQDRVCDEQLAGC